MLYRFNWKDPRIWYMWSLETKHLFCRISPSLQIFSFILMRRGKTAMRQHPNFLRRKNHNKDACTLLNGGGGAAGFGRIWFSAIGGGGDQVSGLVCHRNCLSQKVTVVCHLHLLQAYTNLDCSSLLEGKIASSWSNLLLNYSASSLPRYTKRIYKYIYQF